MLKKIAYPLFLLVFTVVTLEVILHFYNPFSPRLRGNAIVLPTDQTYIIENADNPKLERSITKKTNSLGFHGDEPPASFSDLLTIVTVGGSTTECLYIAEDKTWSYLLGKKLSNDLSNVWLNNAGLDGHSTFGHQILLDDFLIRLKPKVIIYLVGANDRGFAKMRDYETTFIDRPIFTYLKKSELFNLYLNYRRSQAAKKLGVSHRYLDFANAEQLELSESDQAAILADFKTNLPDYKARLEKLVQTTKDAGIEPILVTQPTSLGEGIDPETGADLEKIKLDEHFNGKVSWQAMEAYNQVTRDVGAANGVLTIDLARSLPKNSRYFYDEWHYTNEGSIKIAEILAREISPHLKGKYPQLVSNPQ